MEIDPPSLPQPKKHRKSEGEEKREKRKKRKRKTAEGEAELGSPTKRHKSKPNTEAQAQVPSIPTPTAGTSPFYLQTSSLYLPIAPIAQTRPLPALCAEHISPLLLSYYPPFHGVLMSYSNPRLSSSPHDISSTDGRQKAFARSIDEYAATFVWLTAEFLIFRPQRGDVVEGFVNLQSENSIGIVYWNFFNASIERKNLPREWSWVPGGMSVDRRRGPQKLKKGERGKIKSGGEEELMVDGMEPEVRVEDDLGYWQDGNGKRVERLIRFYVKSVETSRSADREHGFLGVEGSMLDPEEDIAGARGGRLTNGSIFGGDDS